MDKSQNKYADWKKPDKKKECILYDFIYINFRKCKLIYTDRNRGVIAGVGRVGPGLMGQGVVEQREYKETQGNYWGDRIAIILIAVMVSQICPCIKVVYFTYVQFILCHIYVNKPVL